VRDAFEVLAMSLQNPPRRRSWTLVIAISLAVFAAWIALSVLPVQDGPDDKPLIAYMLSK
jgi:hypothetical protein